MSHHSAHPAPETIAAPHPLDPLTGPEIAAARAILEDAGLLGETVRVPMLLPDEPTKTELAAWRPGAPIDRRVDVTLLDTATGVATEAIVSITRGKVLRSERVPNDAPPYGQPQYLFEEYERAEQIVKASPEWQLEDALAAIDYAVPALEVLNSHIELEGRTIVDTISDNAAYGAMVLGDVHKRPDEIDLRWVPGVLSRNGEIEETGVAAGVLGHPATGVAWLANKFHQHGARLEAGEIILAGSFTRPMWVSRGDVVRCDYREMGVIECRFV